MISLLMATYNGEKYIGELLDSILQQTLMPDEIIIVDDVSTDTTKQIIRDFIQEHQLEKVMLLYENTENIGVTKTFERALSLSRYRYVAFCDQDDIWCGDKLQKCFDAINEHKVALVYHDASLIDENGIDLGMSMIKAHHKRGVPSPPFRGEEAQDTYLQGRFCVQGFTMFLDKEFFKNDILPFSTLSYDWWIGALAHIKYRSFYFINEPLVGYRCHRGQLSGAGYVYLENTPHCLKEKNIFRRLKKNII